MSAPFTAASPSKSLLEAALEYAAAGYAVFPCGANKAPIIGKKDGGNGWHDATTNPAQIVEWWTKYPYASIGIPLGCKSGLCGMDLDVNGAKNPPKNGFEHVPDHATLTPFRVKTAGGGEHLYFKHHDAIYSVADSIAYGVDARGEGGYNIFPPSPGYSWIGEPPDLATLRDRLPPYPIDRYPMKDRGARQVNGARAKPRLVSNNNNPRSVGSKQAPAWLEKVNQGGLGVSTFDIEEITAAIDAIENVDIGWDDWVVIGMAIWAATGGSEKGLALFHRFSVKNKGMYVPDEAARVAMKATDSVDGRWNKFFRSPPNDLSAGKLFYLADEADEARGDGRSWRDALYKENPEAASSQVNDGAQATDGEQEGTASANVEATADTTDSNGQNSSGGTDGQKATGGLFSKPFEFIDPTKIPRRQWLYPPYYIRKFAGATISTGGVGKSSLVIVETIAMVTGKPLLGVKPKRGPLRVGYWNGEDPYDELQRRFAAVMKHHGLTAEDVGGRLFVDSGRATEIVIAHQDQRRGLRLNHKVIAEIIQIVQVNQIDVIVVDPFVASHRVAENENSAIELVAKTWSRIAEICNCAVMIVHHSRKTGGQSITVEDARGASALNDAVRVSRALNTMSKDEADKAGIEERERRLYIRSDLGKPNMSRPAEAADWYKLASVNLLNREADEDWHEGDEVGVVTAWAYPRADRPKVTHADIVRAQTAIRAGGPWREDQRSTTEPWVGVPIAEALGVDLAQKRNRAMIVGIIKDWLKNGWLVEVEGKGPKRTLKAYVEAGKAPAADGKAEADLPAVP